MKPFEDKPGRSHHASTQTSKTAAQQVGGPGAQRRKIFELIAHASIPPAQGLTTDELEVETGWEGNSVRPRINELKEDYGLIEYDETTVRKTRRGRGAEALRLTLDGIDVAIDLERKGEL